jgi:CHAD domain-containing protein
VLRLRFRIDGSRTERLLRSASLRAWRSGHAEKRQFTRDWFDSAKRRLHEEGILASREREGENWRIFYSERDPAGYAFASPRASLAQSVPDIPDAAALAAFLKTKLALEAIPVQSVNLHERRLGLNAKDWHGMLILQTGELKFVEEKQPVSEIEFLFSQGDKSSFLADIGKLRTTYELFPLPTGGVLEGHGPGWERGPVRARAIRLHKEMDSQAAARLSFWEGLRQLAANVGPLLESKDPEIVHQMRVAIRRLRAAISVFSPLLTGPDGEKVLAEIKWLAALLGAARDLDVFIEEILDPVSLEFKADIAILRKSFLARRAARYRALREALASPELARLLFDCAAWIEGGTWLKGKENKAARRQPVTEHAAKVLEKRRVKAAAFGDDLYHLAPNELHEARIAIKKLRYAGEFFQSVFDGETVKNYQRRLSKIQDKLGEFNDINVAIHLLHGMAKADDHERRRAADLVIGWHAPQQEKLLEEAVAEWRGFLEHEPFWRK